MAIKQGALTDNDWVVTTRSGAKLAPVTATAFQPFLVRFGMPETAAFCDVAWGAFEDTGTLLGVGVLTACGPHQARAWIGVLPERRRFGIAGDLLAVLVREANERQLRHLTCIHNASDVAPVRLVRSVGLVPTRRVYGGIATMIVPIPIKLPAAGLHDRGARGQHDDSRLPGPG
jgi:GNAT superfamily N-acetyltransferase